MNKTSDADLRKHIDAMLEKRRINWLDTWDDIQTPYTGCLKVNLLYDDGVIEHGQWYYESLFTDFKYQEANNRYLIAYQIATPIPYWEQHPTGKSKVFYSVERRMQDNHYGGVSVFYDILKHSNHGAVTQIFATHEWEDTANAVADLLNTMRGVKEC
jgi:hypothetical protein